MKLSTENRQNARPDPREIPRSAGVYLFWGDGQRPLYIGKSIDLRARVLSHLRTPSEARMMEQTKRIEFIETAGEIGALLLEAKLIKTHLPLFNKRLRRSRTVTTIRLTSQGHGLSPDIVSGKDTAIGQEDGLYGLFNARQSAQDKLRELAKAHGLCLALLGIEKLQKRGCFGLQLQSCRGACVGLESRDVHDQRLLEALESIKVQIWPYRGAIDIVETSGDWTEKHRIHQWRHLSTWCSRTQIRYASHTSEFDLDSYKILVKPLMMETVQIENV